MLPYYEVLQSTKLQFKKDITRLLERNPKLNVIIMSDFIELDSNYKFNILKKRISIYKLIDVVNETIKSISHNDNKLIIKKYYVFIVYLY
jgi:hypothetical protein